MSHFVVFRVDDVITGNPAKVNHWNLALINHSFNGQVYFTLQGFPNMTQPLFGSTTKGQALLYSTIVEQKYP